MWECPHCGQQAITEGVPFCPSCYTPRDAVQAEPVEPVAADSAAPSAEDADIGKGKKNA